MAPHVWRRSRVRKVIGIAALPAFLSASPLLVTAAAATGPDYAAIDSYVSSSLAGTPGFALSIVQGDQIVHARGFGVDGSGAPVNPDTPFVLGSESKSFTALGIMQLNESGAIGLDTPVQTYLPWFRVADPNYSRQITIRQLLNQTSGLPASYPYETAVTSVESRVRDLASVQLAAAPGQQFVYSNSNYDTLGLVIEAVSGQSYADYLQQHVFTPLTMTHSSASESAAKANGLAAGHEWWFGAPIASGVYRSDFVPAGGIASSASDMSHYLIAQLNGGSYAGVQIVSPDQIAAMHRGVKPDNNGKAYGMGWYQATLNGIPVVYHEGEVVTFHTDMILVPSAGWGVELIANASSFTVSVPNSIDLTAQGVISMLMGRSAPFTPSPVDTYIVFDLLIVVLVAFQIWSLVRVVSKPAPAAQPGMGWVLRHIVGPMGWRLVVALAPCVVVFVVLGGMLGASPLLISETDLGASVLVISALLLLNGVTRAGRAFASMGSRKKPEATTIASPTLQEATS